MLEEALQTDRTFDLVFTSLMSVFPLPESPVAIRRPSGLIATQRADGS